MNRCQNETKNIRFPVSKPGSKHTGVKTFEGGKIWYMAMREFQQKDRRKMEIH